MILFFYVINIFKSSKEILFFKKLFPNLIFFTSYFCSLRKTFYFLRTKSQLKNFFPFFLTKPSFFVFVFLRTIFYLKKNHSWHKKPMISFF